MTERAIQEKQDEKETGREKDGGPPHSAEIRLNVSEAARGDISFPREDKSLIPMQLRPSFVVDDNNGKTSPPLIGSHRTVGESYGSGSLTADPLYHPHQPRPQPPASSPRPPPPSSTSSPPPPPPPSPPPPPPAPPPSPSPPPIHDQHHRHHQEGKAGGLEFQRGSAMAERTTRIDFDEVAAMEDARVSLLRGGEVGEGGGGGGGRREDGYVGRRAGAWVLLPIWRREFCAGVVSTAFFTAIVAIAMYGMGLRIERPRSKANQHLQSLNQSTVERPRKILDQSTVLLISADGFRWDYTRKVSTPNIDRLINEGMSAESGITSVYPTVTFPNHYSIVTGLYPESHGIVNMHFTDPATGEKFHPGVLDPKWWIGEPLWQTTTLQGVKTATFFWPGSGVKRQGWQCGNTYCHFYDDSQPFEMRVDTVLSYFDMKGPDRPRFMTLYFEEPDRTAHKYGADAPQTNAQITRIDEMIGRLLKGLEQRGVLDDTHIIFLADHGMLTVCGEKSVYLEDLSSRFKNPEAEAWADTLSPDLSIRPPSTIDAKALYAEMKGNLSTAKNGEQLNLYLKEDMPPRLHYSNNVMIAPILGIAAEGYGIRVRHGDSHSRLGQHGYDNSVSAMRAIFAARGPRFAPGRKVPPFMNLEVYNFICNILGVKPQPNNGSWEFSNGMLLKPA